MANDVEIIIRAKDEASKSVAELQHNVKTAGANMVPVFAAVTAAGVGLGAALTGVVKTAADFEQSLANTQAATGATAEDMKRLRTEALGIGKDTSKSAAEAAAAMGELVKAGVPVEKVVNGVARASVQMAEATGVEVPAAATLMAKALNTFTKEGLTGEQAANAFARAANASAISVTDMGFSLAAVGPVAAAAGLTMNDFATAIGIMGNNALVGSDAGTSLKAFIAGLTPNSKAASAAMKSIGFSAFDAGGQMKSMSEIVANLQRSFAGMSDETRMKMGELLFGSDGIRAMNILLKEGEAGWAKFGAAMGSAPSVAEQSAIRLKTLNGQMEMLRGSLETIAIAVGSVLLPALTTIASAVASGLNTLLEADWSGVEEGFARISTAVSGVDDAISRLLGLDPTEYGSEWEAFGAQFDLLRDRVATFVSQFDESFALLSAAWGQLRDAVGPIIDFMVSQIVEDLGPAVRGIAGFFDEVLTELAPIFEAIMEAFTVAFGAIADLIREHGDEIQQIMGGAWDMIAGSIEITFAIIRGIVLTTLNIIQGDWEGAMYAMQSSATSTFNGLERLFGGFAEMLIGIFSGIRAIMSRAGADIVGGLMEGFKGKIEEAKRIVSSAAEDLATATRITLGIRSPSTVFAEIGRQSMAGMYKGIEDEGERVARLAQRVSTRVAAAAGTAGMHVNDQGAPGGPALVGEHGPEILNMPRGSRITPMGDGGVVNVTINVGGHVRSDRDLLEFIREGLIQAGRRNVSALGGYA